MSSIQNRLVKFVSILILSLDLCVVDTSAPKHSPSSSTSSSSASNPLSSPSSSLLSSSSWQGISMPTNRHHPNQTISSPSKNSQRNSIPFKNGTTIVANNLWKMDRNEWIGSGHLQFTFDLLNSIFINSLDLKTGSLESMAFSPFSIQSLLMMLHLGAKGSTKSEIAKLLRLDSFENNITSSKSHETFGQAVKSLNDDPNISKSLHSANQIFVQETLQISKSYQSALNHYHQSSIRFLNFAEDSYQALNQINDWIEKHTKHMINNFLTSPPSPTTQLMAINAIRFKGDWQFRFDRSDTEKDAWFRMINGQTTTVPMMVAQLPVAYAYNSQLKTSIIELPFKTQRLSLFVLLPNDSLGIFTLLNQLNSTIFANLLYSMRKQIDIDKDGQSTGVNIRLPKFSISSMPRITEILKNQLGMKSLFNAENANLDAMFNRYVGRVQISELLHKAVIKIDEEGSIGAAISSSNIERIGTFNGPYFEADHPFVFLLMDKQTGLTLFAGIYAGPSQSKSSEMTESSSPSPLPQSSSSSSINFSNLNLMNEFKPKSMLKQTSNYLQNKHHRHYPFGLDNIVNKKLKSKIN